MDSTTTTTSSTVDTSMVKMPVCSNYNYRTKSGHHSENGLHRNVSAKSPSHTYGSANNGSVYTDMNSNITNSSGNGGNTSNSNIIDNPNFNHNSDNSSNSNNIKRVQQDHDTRLRLGEVQGRGELYPLWR